MTPKDSLDRKASGSARMIFTLPKDLAAELDEYARALRSGNKSGFVADAIRSYIDHFRRRRHTTLLRDAYAASAEHGRAIAGEWEPLDDETWARLDQVEQKARNRR
jgi:predicted transcriptional regulator